MNFRCKCKKRFKQLVPSKLQPGQNPRCSWVDTRGETPSDEAPAASSSDAPAVEPMAQNLPTPDVKTVVDDLVTARDSSKAPRTQPRAEDAAAAALIVEALLEEERAPPSRFFADDGAPG